jgi:hypothetical protein
MVKLGQKSDPTSHHNAVAPIAVSVEKLFVPVDNVKEEAQSPLQRIHKTHIKHGVIGLPALNLRNSSEKKHIESFESERKHILTKEFEKKP